MSEFNGVEDALRYAYRVEGQAVCKISSILAGLRGSVVKAKGQGPWDRLIESSYIIGIAQRNLPDRLMLIVRGFHTTPSQMVIDRKRRDVVTISRLMWEESGKKIDRYLIDDITREWAGLRRHHTDDWWRKHLGMAPHRFYRLKNGRKDRRRRNGGSKGIIEYLEDELQAAYGIIEPDMREAGFMRDT